MLAENVHSRIARRRAAKPQFGKLALTFVLVVAFLIQGFVTQTHVHLSAQADSFVSTSGAPGVGADANFGASQHRDHKNTPPKDDSRNCPFCQQIALAGTFVSPVVVVFEMPLDASLSQQVLAVTASAKEQASHNWKGRAPPVV